MKVFSFSGYFRLPDDADIDDVKGALTLLAEFWLGPDPKEIEGQLPSEIPKKPNGEESDRIWENFIEVVVRGRRLNVIGGITETDLDAAPDVDEH